MSEDEGALSVWEHLDDLRTVLIRSLIALFTTTLLIFLFSTPIVQLLLETVPQGTQLVALSPQEGLVSVFRLSFWLGLLTASPYIAIQGLTFIKPGLKEREKNAIPAFLILSLLSMGMGILLGFFVTVPLSNSALSLYNEMLGPNLWSIAQYIDYVWLLLFAHALAFEIGALFLMLIHLNIISPESLRQKRRQALIACLIAGALLTPPDVLSQVAIALPLYLFFELSIFYGTITSRSRLPGHCGHARPDTDAIPQSENRTPPRES